MADPSVWRVRIRTYNAEGVKVGTKFSPTTALRLTWNQAQGRMVTQGASLDIDGWELQLLDSNKIKYVKGERTKWLKVVH